MTLAASILISEETRAALAGHAEAAYPEECCGVLVGRGAGMAAVAMRNIAPERARRYLLAGGEWINVEREAGRQGMEIVGVYHSHCDTAAVPSGFDLETAWGVYVYLIVPVINGRAGDMRAWRLTGTGAAFEEIDILSN